MIKIPGTENPADLLTKVLSVQDLAGKLGLLNIGYYSKYIGGSDGMVSGKTGIKQLDLGSVGRLLDAKFLDVTVETAADNKTLT